MGNVESKELSAASEGKAVCKTVIRGFESHPRLPDTAEQSGKEDFREAVTLLHREARASLDRVVESADLEVGHVCNRGTQDNFDDIDAVRAALDELLTQLLVLIATSPSDAQIADAREALKRIGTRDELGSDRAVVEATIRATRLDDPDFGVPSAISAIPREALDLANAAADKPEPVIIVPDCGEANCICKATHRFVWPSGDGQSEFMCDEHTIDAIKLANEMGLELEPEKLGWADEPIPNTQRAPETAS